MFTGLVMAMGRVLGREARGPGARLSLDARFDEEALRLGESIAVDGCCVSVAALHEEGFEADLSAETLARTTLGHLALGGAVNLERSLAVGDRLGGHLVSGHVDGVGQLVDRRDVGEAAVLAFTVPADLARFVAEKGSVAVSGVSLTVNAVTDRRFEVTLIPVTMAATTLGRLQPGDAVNLEVDQVARYVARLIGVGSLPAIERSS